jgi:hypothetical protein
MSSKAISRADLYTLIWQKPLIHLVKDFGCSTQELRSICVANDIPLPRAGHWTQVAAGKSIVQPKLAFRSRYQEKIEILETVDEKRPDKDIPVDVIQPPPIALTVGAGASEKSDGLSIAKDFIDAHPLVKKTLKVLARYRVNLEKSKKSKGRWASIPQEDWPPHEDKGRYSFRVSDGALPITASLEMVEPILSLVDPILKALEAEKFKVYIDSADSNKYRQQLIVEKNGERMTFSVAEGYSWHSPEAKGKDKDSLFYSSKVGVANGNLNFHIEGLMGGVKKTYSHGRRKTLFAQIDDIFNTFLVMPSNQKELRERRERDRRESERRYEINRHNQAIATSQREQLDIALKEASTYREHLALDEYLKQIELASVSLPESEQELASFWIRVVRHHLGNLDPIQKRINRFKAITVSDHDRYYSEHWFKKEISDYD